MNMMTITTSRKEGNLASVHVPLGIPDATVTARSLDELDDDIEFQGIGAWCAAVDPTGVTFSPSLVERENVSSSSTDEEIEVSLAPIDDFDDLDGSPLINALTAILQADPNLPTNWAFAIANEVVRQSDQNDGIDDHSDFSDAADTREITVLPTSCFECGTDWDSTWTLPCWALSTATVWPDPKEFFSDYTLVPLQSIEPPADPPDMFHLAYETEPVATYYHDLAFYDPAPDEILSTEDLHNLTHFFCPEASWKDWEWIHQWMLWSFWLTTMAWDLITYLLIGNGVGPTSIATFPGGRRTSRFLSRRNIAYPLLFFPLSWMILSHSVQIPNGQWVHGFRGPRELPIPSFYSVSRATNNFVFDTYKRVCDIDDMVTLDCGTLLQYNKIKFTVLADGISDLTKSPIRNVIGDNDVTIRNMDIKSEDVDVDEYFDSFSQLPSLVDDCQVETDEDTLQTFMDALSKIADDFFDPFKFHVLSPRRTIADSVWESGDQHLQKLEAHNARRVSEGNGPVTLAGPGLANITSQEVLACLMFGDSKGVKHPVIFDTGASLAITPDKSDFDGPLSVPSGDLRLGGMANGLRIEGIGQVTWTFTNTDGTEVRIIGLAYYVPGAKARLLSPQRLFDGGKLKGHYQGDHKEFRLLINECDPLIIEYDDRTSLPIGYADIGKVTDPQLNITLMDESNQNLTGGQKLLLHWHNRFGHLNLPAVQRILRNVPFLSDKYTAASKCDMRSIKCTVCEFAKGHRRAIKSSKTVPDADHTGALKVEHLKPGVQVSVDHFESRLLGRTFDSYGRASSSTYKGGCMFVDHATGYMHVEHQVGFSAVETIRAKHAFESLALVYVVTIESYLTDSGTFKAKAFVQHIRDHSQRIRYCGANAHHKNGVAERAVQSVSKYCSSDAVACIGTLEERH